MEEIIKKYFSDIGKKGGSVKSERKAESCRKNGKLGGRPKGSKNKIIEVTEE